MNYRTLYYVADVLAVGTGMEVVWRSRNFRQWNSEVLFIVTEEQEAGEAWRFYKEVIQEDWVS